MYPYNDERAMSAFFHLFTRASTTDLSATGWVFFSFVRVLAIGAFDDLNTTHIRAFDDLNTTHILSIVKCSANVFICLLGKKYIISKNIDK